MPLPLARCAFSRSSGGTSTVILRAVSMTPQYTIFDTSIEYGLGARVRNGIGGQRTREHIPRGNPWDRQPFSGKLRRKLGVSPGFATYRGPASAEHHLAAIGTQIRDKPDVQARCREAGLNRVGRSEEDT